MKTMDTMKTGTEAGRRTVEMFRALALYGVTEPQQPTIEARLLGLEEPGPRFLIGLADTIVLACAHVLAADELDPQAREFLLDHTRRAHGAVVDALAFELAAHPEGTA